MIQRIQTIYLFLATVASILVFFFPVATFNAPDFGCVLKITGLTYFANSSQPLSVNTIPLILLLASITILSAIAIFLFKNRQQQLKVVKINIIVAVVFIILNFVFAEKLIAERIQDIKPVTYQAGAYISLVIVVMLILAARRITADENKVKAADRIR